MNFLLIQIIPNNNWIKNGYENCQIFNNSFGKEKSFKGYFTEIVLVIVNILFEKEENI